MADMTATSTTPAPRTFPCSWLVEVPTASLYPPEAEWYPDSAADVYTIVECGAEAVETEHGWACDAGHCYRGLEIESRLDWEREQVERHEEGYR